MKKVFYLSPLALLVSAHVFAVPISDFSEVKTTETATPTIAAEANHAIAIGPLSNVNKHELHDDPSTSKSRKGRYSGAYSIAEGFGANVYGSQSIAYGHEAVANGWKTNAIGSRASAKGEGSVAIGANATTLDGTYYGAKNQGKAVAIGNESKTIHEGAVALGNKAQATGVKSIAIGNDARTLDIEHTSTDPDLSQAVKDEIKNKVNELRQQNVPIGFTPKPFGQSEEATSTIAIGDESRAIGWGSTALGTKAYALNDRATTLGDDSKTLGYAGASVGTHAYSYGKAASALGSWSEALGDFSVSAGPSSSAAGDNSVAMGNGASASGLNAISIGSNTTQTKAWYTTKGGKQVHRAEHDLWNATGDYSIAMGTDSQATEENAIAIGKDTKAIHKRSIALGDNSATTTAKDTSSATVNGITYGGFAGETSVGVVSVGNVLDKNNIETRQIKGVSAGDISPESTDVINGSQLYLITDKLSKEINFIKDNPPVIPPPVNIETGTLDVADEGNVVADSKSGNLVTVENVANAINESSFKITTGSEGNGKAINTTTEKVKAGNTITYKAGNNMEVKQEGKTITYSMSKTPVFEKIEANEFKAGDVVINKNGINAGNKQITNVADAVNDTDAVNYRQLKQTNNQVRKLEDRLNRTKKEMRGGIAQAGAMANIPQVTRSGASGIGVGVANFKSENAISVGYSRMSDNGKHILKTSVGVDTRGDSMVGAGYMFQW